MFIPRNRNGLRRFILHTIGEFQGTAAAQIHIVQGEFMEALLKGYLAAFFFTAVCAIVIDYQSVRNAKGAAIIGGQEEAIDTVFGDIDKASELQAVSVG